MPKLRVLLSYLSKMAKDVLAIAGLIGLLWSAHQFWEKPFENIKKPDVMIRPIHEELASKQLKYSDGSEAKYKLMGLEVKNERDVSDLRIRLVNIVYIDKWSMKGVGIPEEEVTKLVSSLPTGVVINKEIYINVPRIMANGDVLIQFNGLTSNEFKPSSEWFFASSGNCNVYHGMYQDHLVLREFNYTFNGTTFFEFFFYFIVLPYLAFLIYKRAMKLAEQEKENKKVSETAESGPEPEKAE